MQAQRELSLIARRIERSYPQSNTGKGALLMPLADAVAQRSGSHVVLILFGVTACILLLACANVTTLLLARATQRRREVAVRMALGASRGRLIRQFVIESLLLRMRGRSLGEILREDTRGRRSHIHIASRDSAHRVHQLTVGDALHQISRRSRFHQRHEIIVFEMHREDEYTAAQSLLRDLFRRRDAVDVGHR